MDRLSYRGQIALAAGVLAVAAVLTLGAQSAIAAWRPDTARYALQGLLVDAGDGAVDWPVVKANGASFIYVTATRGTQHRDPRFADHWQALGEIGLGRGAVHDFSPCEPAGAQAAFFLSTVPVTAGTLPATLAFESVPSCARGLSRDAVIERVRHFVALVERRQGRPMLLRIGKPVERAFAISAAIDRPLWGMRGYFEPDYLARPWRLWQATAMYRIEGIATPVRWSVIAP